MSKIALNIRMAKSVDYTGVRNFYYSLIDAMEDAEYKPGWEKDVYPSLDFLVKSIESGEFYIGETNGQIVSGMALNQEYNDGYKNIFWPSGAGEREILVIHALGVHPIFAGMGIAKKMVGKAIEIAKENGMKALRLDVLDGNIPAEIVYKKMGFIYIDTIKMFYEDTGWTDFKAFELELYR